MPSKGRINEGVEVGDVPVLYKKPTCGLLPEKRSNNLPRM